MSNYFYLIWKNTDILNFLIYEDLEKFNQFENRYRIYLSHDFDYIYIHYIDGSMFCRFKTIYHDFGKKIDAVFYKKENEFEVSFVKRTTVDYFINLLERKLYEFKKENN